MLFFYTAVQLKPLTALIQDALAHTFWNMQHMASHHHHGHHHLHEDLIESSEGVYKNPIDKIPTSSKFNEEISTHFTQEFSFQFKSIFIYISHDTNHDSNLESVCIPINSPPPRA
jgi:hypothetical protein